MCLELASSADLCLFWLLCLCFAAFFCFNLATLCVLVVPSSHVRVGTRTCVVLSLSQAIARRGVRFCPAVTVAVAGSLFDNLLVVSAALVR